MDARSVINHFLLNPPFEIADTTKYAEFLTFVVNYTLVELSENSDYLDETKFTTPAAANPEDEVIFYDISTLHERFMELIVLEPADSFPDSVFEAVSANTRGFYNISTSAIRAAMSSYSVISYLSVKNFMGVVQKWYSSKVKKVIYRKSEVKLTPSTEYYALFRCSKTLDDISTSEVRTFKQLFEVNLHLHIYQSDIFSAEGGLRSVSLSGLSVSFNVPEAQRKVSELNSQKDKILSTIALDYDDMIGII